MFIYLFIYLVTIWYLGPQFWSQPYVSVLSCTALSHYGFLTPSSRPPLETSLSGSLSCAPSNKRDGVEGKNGRDPDHLLPVPLCG